MAHPSKRKGDAAELDAARQLADLTGFPIRRKLGAGRTDDTGDLWGIPDTVIQIKAYTDCQRAIREGLPELRQQQANAQVPFAALLVRRHGKKEWVAVMALDQFATLLREATQP